MAAAAMRFRVVRPQVDEARWRDLAPAVQARALARAKAREVAAREPGAIVIGCDTVVAVDGRALGQPVDADDASRMLRLLMGRTHSVITAVCVVFTRRTVDRAFVDGFAISRVRLARLSGDEIGAYVDSGEPFGKAGAYAIQGRARSFAALERGRLDTVVGLPMHLLHRLLRELRRAAV